MIRKEPKAATADPGAEPARWRRLLQLRLVIVDSVPGHAARELVEHALGGIEALLGVVPLAREPDLPRPVESHRLRALLQQQHERAGVERRLLAERHRAARGTQVETFHLEG